eukprot:720967_1
MCYLKHNVKLPQYTDKLLDQGFESMRAIKTISSKEELARCGIEIPGHQILILAEIMALQDGGQANNGNSNASNAIAIEELPPTPMIGDTKSANAPLVVDTPSRTVTHHVEPEYAMTVDR